MSSTFGNEFKSTPVIVFRINTLLREIVGTSTICHSQKLLKFKQNVTKRKRTPCKISRCLSCQQIIATTTFQSIQTKEKLTCITKFLAKVKIQYVRKSENPFCTKLNNQRKDIKILTLSNHANTLII